MTYARNPDGTPKAQITTLNPVAQQVFNKQQGIANSLTDQAASRIKGLTTEDFSLSGVPYDPRSYNTSSMPSFGSFDAPYDPRSYGDINSYVDDAGQAAFDHAWNYSKDAFSQDTDRLIQNLQDRGLPVGGEAYTSAVGELQRGHNQAIESMANEARTVAGQEAQRRLGMEQGLRSTAFSEDMSTHQQQAADWGQKLQTEQGLRNTALQEDLLARTQNFNEASAYINGSPALTMPSTPQMPTYNVSAPDVGGITMAGYQNQLAAANAQQAARGSKWQAAANIAGTGAQMAMMSSKKLKHDDGEPNRFLDRVRNVPVRTWRYVPSIDPQQTLHIGPYAEDFAREFGFGDGTQISAIDFFGILMKCVQDLAQDNERLTKRLARLEKNNDAAASVRK